MLNLFSPAKIQVPHWKNTANKKTEKISPETSVHLIINKNICKSNKITVNIGETVYVGQVILESDSFVAASIHSSVSGVVETIYENKVVIKSDGKQTLDPSIKPPIINNDEDFINSLKQSGLIGIGGAGFPTYIKFETENKSKIETLIINAAESEPFITSDTREIIENTSDVLDGTIAIAAHFDIKNIIIGIQKNNEEAISTLEKMISENSKYKNIKIKILPSKYPQNNEKILIKSCTNIVLPLRKLPNEIGVSVLNVSFVGFLGNYLKTGIPLVSRRVTIDGGAIKTPKNIFAPIGTLVKDLVQFCDGYQSTPAKIIAGGPMMGKTLENDEVPITKMSNAITILNHEQASKPEEIECIRCARCVTACPTNILPVSIDRNVRLKNIDELKTLNLNACISCGLCTFICPSNRELLKNIRIGKTMQKNPKKTPIEGGKV